MMSATSNQRKSSRPFIVLLAAGCWLLTASYELLTAQTAWACPMCKDIVTGFMSRMAEGYFWSILLLVSMPFIVVSLIAWRVIRAARRRGTAS